MESIPLLSMETEAANTAWSIDRHCAAALGYSLLPGVRSSHPITPPGNRAGNRNRYQKLRAHLCPSDWGETSTHREYKALLLPTAVPCMSWSREKSKLGTQRKDGERGQWRII